MHDQDRIGSHGEFLFQSLISRMCYNRFFFHPMPMGEKHPTTDLVVELVEPSRIRSVFYVQVKATSRDYSGKGRHKRLKIHLNRSDVEKLKRYPGPTYVAGMDVINGRGYIGGIVPGLAGPIHGLPVLHPIICRNLRALWSEVDTYWNSYVRSIPMASTRFAI
jgi:hypothetical protein